MEPVASWFKVTLRRKLRRGDSGLTEVAYSPASAADALGLILEEFPEGSVLIYHDENDIVTLMIDWAAVPDHLRSPVIPRRRR